MLYQSQVQKSIRNYNKMDYTYPPIQQPNLYPNLQADGSMLGEALKNLSISLPQPFPVLQSHISNMPFYMKDNNLYKNICTYNKNLIYNDFQTICDLVLQVYHNIYPNSNYFNINQYLNALYTRLDSFANGNYYLGYVKNNLHSLQAIQNKVSLFRSLMTIIGLAHFGYFKIPTRTDSFLLNDHLPLNSTDPQGKLPQKYHTIIQQKLNIFAKPVGMNYFEKLISQTLAQKNQNNYQNVKTQEQIQADKMANGMKKFFMSKYVEANTAKNGGDKQNGNKPFNMPNNYSVFPGQYSNPTEINKQNSIEKFILQNLALSIQDQQLNNNRNFTENKNIGIHEFQIDDWLSDNTSQMSYYQSYMMAHMADLIFLQPDKFDYKLIKYQPYLHQLYQQINQQINNIKSEMTAFKIIYQSNLKHMNQEQYQKVHNQYPGWVNNEPYQRQMQVPINQFNAPVKQKQKSIFNKTVKVVQKIFQKVKKPAQSQSVNTNTYVQQKVRNTPVLIKQQQKIVMSKYMQKMQYQYNNIIQALQKLNLFIQGIYNSHNVSYQHKVGHEQNDLFHKIVDLTESVKNKVTGQNLHNYHEVQSWIAIVIILYKQIAFNQLYDFQYTPLKRRIITKICKRIFIQQNKSNKNNNKKSVSHGFRNWPIVLKFLQNNRPEIMYDRQGIANQKAVDDILKQFYEVIKLKKMANSTFGGLFDGLPPLKQVIPQIKLVCLSSGANLSQNLNKNKSSTQCKVVHILVSGFLSEDTNKLQQWSDMVDMMPDSQIYALVWQSSTIKNLVKFFLKSAADILGAIKMMDELRRKYTDNPFNPAFEVAQITGRILAQLIKRIFPNRFINICGYSLGSEVIKQFLNGMIRSNSTGMINNIYLMGGVSHTTQYQQLISQSRTPISIYNCYTKYDSVLKHLLSLCKPDIKPIGLNELKKVRGHSVINVDCTKFISGHLAFRSNLSIMGEVLQISNG